MMTNIAVIACGFLVYSLTTSALIWRSLKYRGDTKGSFSAVLLGGVTPTVCIYISAFLGVLLSQSGSVVEALIPITFITAFLFVLGLVSSSILSIFAKWLKWGKAFLVGFSVSALCLALVGYLVVSFD